MLRAIGLQVPNRLLTKRSYPLRRNKTEFGSKVFMPCFTRLNGRPSTAEGQAAVYDARFASGGRRGAQPPRVWCSIRTLSVLPSWSSTLSTHLTRRFAAKGVAARGHVDDFWRRVPSDYSILKFFEYFSTPRMTRYFRGSRKFRSRRVRWNVENQLLVGQISGPS